MLKNPKSQAGKTNKKQNLSHRQNSNDHNDTIERLSSKIGELESQLYKANQCCELYLRQISILEEDNLKLCTRIQQLKHCNRGDIESYLEQSDKLARKVNQLLEIITNLENANHVLEQNSFIMKEAIQRQQKQIIFHKQQQVKKQSLISEIQRLNVKCIQSQNYWMSRTQKLLEQQSVINQKAIFDLEKQYISKMSALNGEINKKQRQNDQKTTQIYKLIEHIQNIT